MSDVSTEQVRDPGTCAIVRRYFFVHVMKTGGTTFDSYVRQNFAPEEIYAFDAVRGVERQQNYVNANTLLANLRGRWRGARFVRGHVPFATTQLAEPGFTTMTILREPVDRTISFLHHARLHHPEHKGVPLEEIYADEWWFASFIDNYQVKLFAMTREEATRERRPETNQWPPAEPRTSRSYYEALGSPLTEAVTVDDARLRLAKENVGSLDVVGFTDRYDGFLAELERRYGWRIKRARPRNTSERLEVSPALRRRIARDLEADTELYEAARRARYPTTDRHAPG